MDTRSLAPVDTAFADILVSVNPVKCAFKPERKLLALLSPQVLVGRVKEIFREVATPERFSNWARGPI